MASCEGGTAAADPYTADTDGTICMEGGGTWSSVPYLQEGTEETEHNHNAHPGYPGWDA